MSAAIGSVLGHCPILTRTGQLAIIQTRRSISVHWVARGTCYSKTEGTGLDGIELQRSRQFFQVGGH